MAASTSDWRESCACKPSPWPSLKVCHMQQKREPLKPQASEGKIHYKPAHEATASPVPYQESARWRPPGCWKCQGHTSTTDSINAIGVTNERAERMINYRHFKRKRRAWPQATPASISPSGLLSIFVIFGCWLASAQVAPSTSDQSGRLATAAAIGNINSSQSSISDKSSPMSSSQQLGALRAQASADRATEGSGWAQERLLNAVVADYAPAVVTHAFQDRATSPPSATKQTIGSRFLDDADECNDKAPEELQAGQQDDQMAWQHQDNAQGDDDYNDYGTYIIYGRASEDKSVGSEPGVQETRSNSTPVSREQPLQRVFFAARQARETEEVLTHYLAEQQHIVDAPGQPSTGRKLLDAQVMFSHSKQTLPPRRSISPEFKKTRIHSLSNASSARTNDFSIRELTLADNDTSRPNQISTIGANLPLQLEPATIIDGSLASEARDFLPRSPDRATLSDNNEPFAPDAEHLQRRLADHLSDRADSAPPLPRPLTEARESASADKVGAYNHTTTQARHEREPSSSSGLLVRRTSDTLRRPQPAATAASHEADASEPPGDRRRARRHQQHNSPHHRRQQLEPPPARANRSVGTSGGDNSKLVDVVAGSELGEEDVEWLSKMNANADAIVHMERVVSSAPVDPSDDMRHGQRSWARDNEQSEHDVVADQADKSANNVTLGGHHQRERNDYKANEAYHHTTTSGGADFNSDLLAFVDKVVAVFSGRDRAPEPAATDNEIGDAPWDDPGRGKNRVEVSVETAQRPSASAPRQLAAEHNPANMTDGHVAHNVYYWRLIWFVLPLGAIFGNLLVILAVYRERSLQSVTNYFIVSLAFADLFVGLIVMPFALHVLVNEVWELSDVLCDIFVAVDVTSSTASILNLVAISIDRYLAIAHPIAYSAGSSSTRASLTIFIVWLISCCVGAPIILGLNTTPERKSTLCILYNSTFIFWSSLTSFYVPCFIMIGLYWRIFSAIRTRTKKAMTHHNHQNVHLTTKKAAPAAVSCAPPADGSGANRQSLQPFQPTGEPPEANCEAANQQLALEGAPHEIDGTAREHPDENGRPSVRFPAGQAPRTSSCKRYMQSLDVQPAGQADKPNPAAPKSRPCQHPASHETQPPLSYSNPITAANSSKPSRCDEPAEPDQHSDGLKLSLAHETSKLGGDSALGTCVTNGDLVIVTRNSAARSSQELEAGHAESPNAGSNVVSPDKDNCLNLSRLAEREQQMASKRCLEHSVSGLSNRTSRHRHNADLERASSTMDVDNLDDDDDDDDDDDVEACDVPGCLHHHRHLHDESLCNSTDFMEGQQNDSSSSTRSSTSYDCSLAIHSHLCKRSQNQTSTPSHANLQHRCCRRSLANCINCEHHQATDKGHIHQLATPTHHVAKNDLVQRKRSSVLSSNFCCDSYPTSTHCASHMMATSVSCECAPGRDTGPCAHTYCACYDQLHFDNSKIERLAADDSSRKGQEKACVPNGSPKREQHLSGPIGVIESARQKIERRSMRLTNILRGRAPSKEVGGALRKVSLDQKFLGKHSQPLEFSWKLSGEPLQRDNVFRISGREILTDEEPKASSVTNDGALKSRLLNDEFATHAETHKLDCLKEVEPSSQAEPVTTTNIAKSSNFIHLEGASIFDTSVIHIGKSQMEYVRDEEAPHKPTQQAVELSMITGDKLTTVTSSTGRSSTTTDKTATLSDWNNNKPALVPVNSRRSDISQALRKEHSTNLVTSMLDLIHRKDKGQHAVSGSKHFAHPKDHTKDHASAASKSQLKSQLVNSCASNTRKNQQQAQRHRAGGGSRRRREKNAARRERKATKTLAIVLGIFLICWLPFFTCNIIDGICIRLGLPESRPGMTAYLITSWLGYMNSCVNPIIYTIFNMEFRRAFKRILTTRPDCSYCSSCIE